MGDQSIRRYKQLYGRGPRILLSLLLSAGLNGVPGLILAETLPNMMWGRSVVKVMASTKQGRISMGSGVVVAPDRVATNCHVSRKAASIIVSKGIRHYRVVSQSALPERDVCILHTANLKLPAARLGKIDQSVRGNDVFVFGFGSAVGLGMVRGTVNNLHEFGNDFIVETDAGFMHGTSGGALFTGQGDLIALATFMLTKADGGEFYAVPVEWIHAALKQSSVPVSEVKGLAFWEKGDFVRQEDLENPATDSESTK